MQTTTTLSALQEAISGMEAGRRPNDSHAVSSGYPELDRVLPCRGFPCGSLVEWLTPGEGHGAEIVALAAAREACRGGAMLVVLDRFGTFHPPAAVRLGIAAEQILVVHTADEADHAWAVDQVLRCRGVGAALIWTEARDGKGGRQARSETSPSRFSTGTKTFRRWQLAAETAQVLGLLIRPDRVAKEPSWATARLRVEPHFSIASDAPPAGPPETRRLRIEVLRVQGARAGACVEVECP